MKKQQPKTFLIELLLASVKGSKEKNDKQQALLDILEDPKFNPSALEKVLQNKDLTDNWIEEIIDGGILSMLNLEKIESATIYRISNSEELPEEKKKEVLTDLITRIRLDPNDWKDLRIRIDKDWKDIERIRLDNDWDRIERIRLDKDWEKNLGIQLDPDSKNELL
ncbi:hypothetical protein ACWGOQ_0009150 [Aquimarina sp. M1]